MTNDFDAAKWLGTAGWWNNNVDGWNSMIDGARNNPNDMGNGPIDEWAKTQAAGGNSFQRTSLGYDPSSTMGRFVSAATSAPKWRNTGGVNDPDAVSAFQSGVGFGANRSDDELRAAYDYSGGAANGDLTAAYQDLMTERRDESVAKNQAYQGVMLGGNYGGGVLPGSGYKPDGYEAKPGGLGGLGGWGTSQQPASQSQQPQWGGAAASPSGNGGLGGLGGWGGPFATQNPWAAS